MYDAKGSKRLVNYFLKKFKKVELRAFKNTDKYFLFNLVNDPSVRFSSLKTNKIKFHNHIRWLNNLKRNKKNKLEILKCNDLKIGQIRLEKKQNFYNLDYSISNEFRRMGFGSKMIKLAIKKFKLQEIKAQTRANNISSIKTLEKSGFKRISKSKGIYNYLFSG